MSLQSAIGLLFDLSFYGRLFKGAAGSLLGLAVLGWVVEHCGPRNNEVVVHVMEPDVEVTVDDQIYQIDSRRYEPIACELAEGRHHLLMRRGDCVLFDEWFEVRPGQNVVLTAWDEERLRREARAMRTQDIELSRRID
jgi:hypothetical protein